MDSAKGLGIPSKSGLEGKQRLIIGLPEGWGTRDSSLGEHKQKFAALRPREEEQCLHKRLNHHYLLVLEGLLWPPEGRQGLTTGMRALEGPPGVNPLGLHH